MAIVYNGQYRLQGASTWGALFSARSSTSYTWDTSALPAGTYEVQVQAVDTSDDAASPWSATRTVTVAHAAAPAANPLVVTEAEYRVGAGSWTPLFSRLATDRYTLDTRAFADGASIGIRLRARDLSDDAVSPWSATRTITIDHPAPAPVVYTGALAPLRGITTAERDSLLSRELVVLHRFSVKTPGGVWTDVGTLAGDDYLISAEWDDTDDAPVQAATFTLHREIRGTDGVVRSLAPYVADSPLNAGGALIRFGAEAKLETATVPRGATVTSGAWATVWAGYLDDPQWGKATITVPGRSGARRAMDTTVVEAKTYGAAEPNSPALADVLRQKLADNGLSGVTLAVVGNPDWFMRPAEQAPGPQVLDALTSDALAIGWLLRDRWTGRGTQELALYEPVREAIVASLPTDLTLGPDDYIDVPDFRTDTDGVRNIVYVSYLNADGDLVRFRAEDASSIAAYGPRAMQLAYDAATNINTEDAASALAGYAVHDLAEPATVAQIELRYFWAVGPGDVVELEPNGVHDSAARRYVVTAVHHTLSKDAKRTRLSLRSRAGGSPRVWLDRVVSAGGVGSNNFYPLGGAANALPAEATVTVKQVASDADTVTFRVSAAVWRGPTVLESQPDVRLSGLSGLAAPVSGPGLGETAPSGTLYTFARPEGAPGVATWETVRIGAVNDSDSATVAELGADTSGGSLRCEARLVPIATTETTVVVDVTATDDNHPGEWLRLTAEQGGLVDAPSPAVVEGPSPLTQTYTIPRPPDGSPPARPVFIAEAINPDGSPRAGMVPDSDSVDVQPATVPIAKLTEILIRSGTDTTTTSSVIVTAQASQGGYAIAAATQVRLIGMTPNVSLVSGPGLDTWADSGSEWVFDRPSDGVPGEVQFESTAPDAGNDTDFKTIVHRGFDLEADGISYLRVDLQLVPEGTTDIEIEVKVTATDDTKPGAWIKLTTEPTGLPTPISPTMVSGPSPLVQNFIIPRPAKSQPTARPRFVATGINPDGSARSNAVSDADSMDVTAREISTVPFLTVSTVAINDQDTIVEVTGSAWGIPGVNQTAPVQVEGDGGVEILDEVGRWEGVGAGSYFNPTWHRKQYQLISQIGPGGRLYRAYAWRDAPNELGRTTRSEIVPNYDYTGGSGLTSFIFTRDPDNDLLLVSTHMRNLPSTGVGQILYYQWIRESDVNAGSYVYKRYNAQYGSVGIDLTYDPDTGEYSGTAEMWMGVDIMETGGTYGGVLQAYLVTYWGSKMIGFFSGGATFSYSDFPI